ncbi:cell division protein FtsA [Calidifontibacillus erzurumensis]|uniref:cell division protein FtsA n=1 Tax=Calidifontibacillus erzurumensis TaxID=2741433 RepID=UPI0035B54815
MNEQSSIFALDIGTRSVVGIILKKNENGYEVIDIEAKEHEKRAMLDGQIHDIPSVSMLIQEIKAILEDRHGPLKKVFAAAAGRALKTKRATATIQISGKPIINYQDIYHLELSAVQEAQKQLAKENLGSESFHYYCVGYSVMRYFLDNEEIGSLLEQQGEIASVEVIATFLPKVVVESLISALHRAGLELEALTLEPIAAINVLIPPSMRRLNVALVDIGAGTSDIAITNEGTVVAYGMVPIAGDEITEAISDQYLLDFPLAEKAKRDLLNNSSIKITDILGFETEVPREEVIKAIWKSLDKLATAICDEILMLNNQKPPKAVMLVGGGSLTPELPKLLAEKLNLPENRVAIRGIEAIQNLKLSEQFQTGPEWITPIGIAISAKQHPIQYITVYVNERPVRLFNVKKLTIGDCLLAAGIELNKLYGKPGMAMIVTLNNRDITIPGNHGNPPTILKNGQPTNLDDTIIDGDSIIVEKGEDGKAAEIKIKELVEETTAIQVWINEQPYKVEMEIFINGHKVDAEEYLCDHDRIETKFPKTIGELLHHLNMTTYTELLDPFYVYYNRTKVTLPKFAAKIFKNGIETKATATIYDQDKIMIKQEENPKLIDLLNEKGLSLYYQIPITFNGEPLVLRKSSLDVFRNGKLLKEDSEIYKGDELQAVHKQCDPFIFQDIFRYVKIQFPKVHSGNFTLLKNGQNATFHDQLAPGDDLAIQWPTQTSEFIILNRDKK